MVETLPATELTPLEQLARDYIAHGRAKRWSARTLEQVVRQRIERIFLPWCRREAIIEPAQLTQRVMDRWSAELLDKGGARGKLAPESVRSYARTVNAFCNWARSEGEAITAKAELPKVPKRWVEPLTEQEIRAMERVTGGRNRLIIRILDQTGVRASELLGVGPADLFDGGDRNAYLRVIGKGDIQRAVPCPAPLAREIRAWVRQLPLDATKLFLSQRMRRGVRGELTVSGLEDVVRFAARDAGVTRHVWPHLFRHTYVSRLVRQGVDSTVIRRVVGHRDTQMIDQVYGHLRGEDLYGLVLNAMEDAKSPR